MCTHPKADDFIHAERNEFLEIAQSLLNKLKPVRRMAFVLREIEVSITVRLLKFWEFRKSQLESGVWRARNDLNNEFRKHMIRRGQR